MTCCWWCTLDIPEGKSVALPYLYDSRKRQFKTMGSFCCWECVKAYNLHENKLQFGVIQNNITLLRLRLYGKIGRIFPSPSRYCLDKFGGPMTEEEYCACRQAMPPVITMPENEHFINTVQERDHKSHVENTKVRKQRLDNINNSTNKTDALKLRRPVPVKHKSNNLADVFGFGS